MGLLMMRGDVSDYRHCIFACDVYALFSCVGFPFDYFEGVIVDSHC